MSETNIIEQKDLDALEKLFDSKLNGVKDRIFATELALEKSTSAAALALERSTAAAALALEKSTVATVLSIEKRLEGMNEFGAALQDQASGFFTKAEHSAYQKVVDSDLRILRESRAELKGKASQASLNITFVLAAIGAISGLVAVILDFISKVVK